MEFLRKNFANWTSGNEIIDNFIQEKQSYYVTSSYERNVVFEWIPYDKFIEIEKIEGSDFATAIWKDGSLSYDDKEEWIRISYEEVILRILYVSENITDEFINKVKSYLTYNKNYGISQNPDTRNYILVFSNEYFDDYCQKCETEENCLTTAIWEKGPLIYNTLKKEWVKTSYKKVESYLTDEKYYGVSQNQIQEITFWFLTINILPLIVKNVVINVREIIVGVNHAL
ncbi:unnamed protein product [Rhizophagus irregularis]|nr:unnamed protein product [Rhizophagus irregularis]